MDQIDSREIEYEPEYLMEFDRNPDIDDTPPMSLEEVLHKSKPFLMAYEGIKCQEEWEESNSQLVVLNRIVSYTLLGVFLAGVTYTIISFLHYCLLRCQPDESIVIRLQHNRQSTTCEPNLAIQSQLDAIPVLIYGNSHPLLPLNSGTGSEEACSVCLGEYVAGENVRVMPKCRHMFHRECIDRWLTTRSAFCPICRGCVVESNDMNDEGYQQRLEVPMLEIQVVPPTRIL